MPEMIEARVRVRKEKLGDLIIDMPKYAEIKGLDVVRELELNPIKTLSDSNPKGKPLSAEHSAKVKELAAKGLSVADIASQAGVSMSYVYKNRLLKTKIKRRWIKLPDSIVAEVLHMKSEGKFPSEISNKLGIAESVVTRAIARNHG